MTTKKSIFLLFCIFVISVQFSGISVFAAEINNSSNERTNININSDWKFFKGKNDEAYKKDLDDSSWTSISLPHTWNGGDGTNLGDGEDGGSDYFRGDGWYRKQIPWSSEYENKRVYIQFLGANTQTEVYINGELLGNHKGGFEAFRFDLTDKLQKDTTNVLAVKVNNEATQEVAPIGADFTFFGGIYRNVSLIVTNPVHIDTMDHASSGLYLTPTNVSDSSANLEIKSNIVNDSEVAQNVTVKAVLKTPDSIDWTIPEDKTPFDESKMIGGEQVGEALIDTFTIEPNQSYEFKKSMTVNNPHLWNGIEDPYRYQVDIEVSVNGNIVDNLSDFVGFRYFHVDKNNGFYLNGKAYPLRGVSRHQDREAYGWALKKEHHDEDFSLIYDMGANTMRLAHYPHDPYFYELCDKYGMVIWAELPFVNGIGGSGSYENPDETRAEFFRTTKLQLTEFIRQQYNRPSICFWGLCNEIDKVDDAVMSKFMPELNNLVKSEDHTGRLTAQAVAGAVKESQNWTTDLVCRNGYPGWYYGSPSDLGPTLDSTHNDPNETRPVGISEYGSGSNVNHHTDDPKIIENVSSFTSEHPEEYENICHEEYLNQINPRPYLWATFVWNMFDFSVDTRAEGGQKGINDKGLVTRDRKTNKDAYYLYKANWNNREKFVYITSRRFNPRDKAVIEIKGYSNCDKVQLTLNGNVVSTLTQQDLAQPTVFKWGEQHLNEGENIVKMEGFIGDKIVSTDTVTWEKDKSGRININTDDNRLNIGLATKEIQLNGNVKANELTNIITSTYNSTFELFESDGTTLVTGETLITSGMKLIVTSENGQNKEPFTFSDTSISIGKTVTASSYQNNVLGTFPVENAVDQDFNTKWVANNYAMYPQWIKLDLGKIYNLSHIDISWFENGAYKYKISLSDDDKNYTEVIDRTNNELSGKVIDNIENKKARYILVDVLGNSEYDPSSGQPPILTGAASIYELQVYGWNLSSDKYIIDDLSKTITILKEDRPPQADFTPEVFYSNIKVDGNATPMVRTNTGYFVADGDFLDIIDSNETTTYTIRFSNSIHGDLDNDENITAADASLVLQHVLNPVNTPFSEIQKKAADYDKDSTVTANDAAYILNQVILKN